MHSISYMFHSTFMQLLDQHVPLKKKYVSVNNAPYMNKTWNDAKEAFTQKVFKKQNWSLQERV